ncbi:class II aldolase/adducin family protein [Alphaproteobacteria bacterium]|nr:class II aldolase/adducin family protein [Alphaproteobacteria bacterium]
MTQKYEVSNDEWNVRCDLAACYRLCFLLKITDRINTHISAKVTGTSDEFLLNPVGLLFDEVTASNLVKLNYAGKKIDNQNALEFNSAGYVIHSAILESRADVSCVIHHHSIAAISVGIIEEGFLPLDQHGFQFYGKIGYHDYKGFGTSISDEKKRLSKDMGDKKILFMRNHGVLICGSTVGEAFCLMDDLEQACKVQIATLSMNKKLRLPSDEIINLTVNQFDSIGRPGGEKEWPAMKRILERKGIKYQI